MSVSASPKALGPGLTRGPSAGPAPGPPGATGGASRVPSVGPSAGQSPRAVARPAVGPPPPPIMLPPSPATKYDDPYEDGQLFDQARVRLQQQQTQQTQQQQTQQQQQKQQQHRQLQQPVIQSTGDVAKARTVSKQTGLQGASLPRPAGVQGASVQRPAGLPKSVQGASAAKCVGLQGGSAPRPTGMRGGPVPSRPVEDAKVTASHHSSLARGHPAGRPAVSASGPQCSEAVSAKSVFFSAAPVAPVLGAAQSGVTGLGSMVETLGALNMDAPAAPTPGGDGEGLYISALPPDPLPDAPSPALTPDSIEEVVYPTVVNRNSLILSATSLSSSFIVCTKRQSLCCLGGGADPPLPLAPHPDLPPPPPSNIDPPLPPPPCTDLSPTDAGADCPPLLPPAPHNVLLNGVCTLPESRQCEGLEPPPPPQPPLMHPLGPTRSLNPPSSVPHSPIFPTPLGGPSAGAAEPPVGAPAPSQPPKYYQLSAVYSGVAELEEEQRMAGEPEGAQRGPEEGPGGAQGGLTRAQGGQRTGQGCQTVVHGGEARRWGGERLGGLEGREEACSDYYDLQEDAAWRRDSLAGRGSRGHTQGVAGYAEGGADHPQWRGGYPQHAPPPGALSAPHRGVAVGLHPSGGSYDQPWDLSQRGGGGAIPHPQPPAQQVYAQPWDPRHGHADRGSRRHGAEGGARQQAGEGGEDEGSGDLRPLQDYDAPWDRAAREESMAAGGRGAGGAAGPSQGGPSTPQRVQGRREVERGGVAQVKTAAAVPVGPGLMSASYSRSSSLTGSGCAGSGQGESGYTWSGPPGCAPVGSSHTGPGWAGWNHRGSLSAGAGQTGPGLTGPGQTGSCQTGSGYWGQQQAGYQGSNQGWGPHGEVGRPPGGLGGAAGGAYDDVVCVSGVGVPPTHADAQWGGREPPHNQWGAREPSHNEWGGRDPRLPAWDHDVCKLGSDSGSMRVVSRPPGVPPQVPMSASLTLGERIDPRVPLEQQHWYHGAVGRADAELLLRACREGAYLVRNSESNWRDFSLSVKSAQGYMHLKIVANGYGRYILGQFSQPFYNIPQMVYHYTMHKLPIKGAEHMSLMYPVSNDML